MSGWRELIDENSTEKTENNIHKKNKTSENPNIVDFVDSPENEKKDPVAKIAKTPEKPIIANIADIALRSESEFLPIATDRLKEIVGDIMWSADDLLDWYKDDFLEIARSPLDQVKEMVADYLNSIDSLRGEDSHIAKMMNPYHVVMCSKCQHWTRDQISAGGIGACDLHSVLIPPAFPNAPRRCFEYKEV